jgi:hypothetical protein
MEEDAPPSWFRESEPGAAFCRKYVDYATIGSAANGDAASLARGGMQVRILSADDQPHTGLTSGKV